MKSDALQAGDIVIMSEKSFSKLTPAHTVICLGGNRIAHAAPNGVVMGEFPPVLPAEDAQWAAEGFRLGANAGLASGAAAEAAFYAERWSVADGQEAVTKYGTGRASGIKQQLKASPVQPPPFEFDALYRALKWASRNDEGVALSRNKGITCCAFVTACYQAGILLRLAFWDAGLIARTFEQLSTRRVNKKAVDNHELRHRTVEYRGEQVPNYYKREVSNVGQIDPQGPTVPELIDEMLKCFLQDRSKRIRDLNTGRLTAADLFTKALAHDAKFYHSLQLHPQLRDDPMWTQLGAVVN